MATVSSRKRYPLPIPAPSPMETVATVGSHVVAMPYPGRGHINPMLILARLLAARGLLVTFVVTEEWLGFLTPTSPALPPNLRLRLIPNVIPSEVGRAKDFSGFLEAVYTKMEAPFERLLDQLDPPPTAIVADTYLPWAVAVAGRRGVPMCSLFTMSAAFFARLYHFERLIAAGHGKVQKGGSTSSFSLFFPPLSFSLLSLSSPMDSVDNAGSPVASPAVAFEFPVGETPAKMPRRIRRRLLESSRSSTAPSSVEEIEAKLKEADQRRQQFHEWLASKARPKPRSPSWSSSQEEDLGQRLEAKLYAAEQKRLSLLAKAQVRLARLDELRQAARNGVEMRFEKEREKLGTKVESRVQQAEANRLRLLKAHKQRRAVAQERTARSLLQRVIRENKYKESVHSTILQKRAAAEKNRMKFLQAEKIRARARVMQARRVAKIVNHQREIEQRKIKEQLENRLQRAKRQREEYLKQRGSPHKSVRLSWNKHGEFLSRKLARCWRRFVKSRKTTFALAKAFEALEINENSVKSMPFEHFALRIESAKTLQTVKALLDRLETRFMLSRSSSSSSPENIDHLLKRLATPKKRTPSAKTTRARVPAKRGSPKASSSSEVNKLPRYLVRVVLCAYMILGHPTCVFSGQGQCEATLGESAETFVREFELLIKIVVNSLDCSYTPRQSSPDVLVDTRESAQLSGQRTFRSQLMVFDTAWRSYLYHFVVWKVKDARSLEDDLVRAACQLELSMMQKCKLTVQGQTCDLTHDMKAIQRQVSEDQNLLRDKVLHLSGDAGVERMECALTDTRSKFFVAKENGNPLVGPIAHISSSTSSSSSTQPSGPTPERLFLQKNETPNRVVRSIFGSSSSVPNAGMETVSAEVQSSGTMNKRLPLENELLVNEIIHGGVSTLTNNYNNQDKDSSDIKAKIKETMEKAFWDGILESLKKDTPDFGRIVNLVKEVRDELCEMTPQSWKQEIYGSIDLDILSQVLESGTQDTDYLGRILQYALLTLQKLSAPANDEKMKNDCQKLLSELAGITESGKQSSSLLFATVKGLRFVLEQIQALKTEISKARIQMMEPIIKGSNGVEYLQKAFADRHGPPSSAATSLPLTAQWISSLATRLEEEWTEHISSLSLLSTNNGLPVGAVLRTGGSTSLTSKQSPRVGGEQPECSGEKVDILVRLGLLKLVSGVEGVTADTVPETFKLNALRLRALQGQLQQLIVISTSMLILRQILVSESPAPSPSEVENIIANSLQRLTELLESGVDIGIDEIVGAIIGSETKLETQREVMGRLLSKSLQSDDAVFNKVARAIYLAVRGVVLGGNGARGRALSEAALRRVGAGMLSERVVKVAEGMVKVAMVSTGVHGPWYRSLLR